MPLEPPPTRWDLAHSDLHRRDDLVAVGADLEPGTLLAAYRRGLFPMGLGTGGRRPMGWWCPLQRGVLLPGGHHVSRSLRRSRRGMACTLDQAFEEVVRGCADPSRSGAWITADIASAYRRLHELGWAHSVEVWSAGGDLVGGLYGLAIGGLFAGESMFHVATDASKVALWALTELVFEDGDPRRMIDVQWQTPHLATQGIVRIPREEYLHRLRAALQVPPPAAWQA